MKHPRKLPTSILIDCAVGRRLLGNLAEKIQIRSELQHLWAVWSEALADEYGQDLKYGTGPSDLQELLAAQSEIFRLLEQIEELTIKGLKRIYKGRGAIRMADLLSDKPLPVEVLEAKKWFGELENLVQRKEEAKKRIAREILALKRLKRMKLNREKQ